MNNMRKILCFYLFFYLTFQCTPATGQTTRWIACQTLGLNSVFNNGEGTQPIPLNCLQQKCNPSNLDRAVITKAGETTFTCNCAPQSTMTPMNEAAIMADFLNCNLRCTGGKFLERCGGDQGNFGMWYQNSTQNGTFSINMCYDKTTMSELNTCRMERTASALFVGRSVNGFYKEVMFVNPCGISNGNCASNADCTFDSDSGYRTCACRGGLQPNMTGDTIPGFSCMDLDECSNDTLNECNATFATCMNTIGSYTCQCKERYVDQDPGNAGRNCTPVFDECRMRISPQCTSKAICTNNPTPPGHTCSCPTGYTGDGLLSGSGCADVDECVVNNGGCLSQTSNCANTMGSFTCTCKDGFIKDRFGMCTDPYQVVACSGTEPSASDRRVAYGSGCSVAVLFACGDTALGQSRVRIPQTGTGPYDNCVGNQLQSNFTSSNLNQPNAFVQSRGMSLLKPNTSCTAKSFAVTFLSAPAKEAGFNLSSLFMGGLGDFSTVYAAHGNDADCKGQVWVENGLKYRFQTSSDSQKCGVTRTNVNNKIVYSGTVRGSMGNSGSVVSRAQDFSLTFTCSYDVNAVVSNSPDVFFYDLGRRKRDAEAIKEFDFPGSSDLSLTMSLRKDGEYSAVKEVPLHRKAGEKVHIEAVLHSRESTAVIRSNYGLKVLRCWESLKKDGMSTVYKNIIADNCDPAEIKSNPDYTISTKNNDNNFKFSFNVKSMYGGVEDVYVSCLFDILSPGKTCRSLETTPRSLHIDPYMIVRTVGPIKVHDTCGGKYRGGCQHYCRESNDKPVCSCAKGFTTDSSDPTKCFLTISHNQSSNSNMFYLTFYVVVPIAAITLIVLLIFFIIRVKSHVNSKKGMYKMNDNEPRELSDDAEPLQ